MKTYLNIDAKLYEKMKSIVLLAIEWRDQAPTGTCTPEDKRLIKAVDDYEEEYYNKEG